MSIKVSVVVPVYNPGPHVEPLLASLGRQTMPADQFETVFVDDGCTDGTARRLDDLAVRESNVRVVHIANSGWPGRPRNVGMDAARGEYVYFVDNDDAIGDEALDRLYAYAEENGSDVVVGKVVRPNVAWRTGRLFTHNRPNASLSTDPELLTLLTPHKLFRRRFLADHGIRFPEGRRRLEDHYFVMTAYFCARVISVLADYPCYLWHKRPGSASNNRIVWADYYRHLRDTLDVVDAHTEPGPDRDRLLAHWFRAKGLALLGAKLSRRSESSARELLEALRCLTLDRFPPSVDDQLAGVLRVRGALLRAGELDTLRALADTERGMTLDVRVEDVRVHHRRCVELTVTAALVLRDGTPLVLEQRGERAFWLPSAPVGPAVGEDLLDFTDGAARVSLQVYAQRGSDRATLDLPGSTVPLGPADDGVIPIGATRVLQLDPGGVHGGEPIGLGSWHLVAELRCCGWAARRKLSSDAFVVRLRSSRTRVTGGRRVRVRR